MVPSLAFVGGLVVDSRRSKFHVADPTKGGTEIRLNEPFKCAKFQPNPSMRSCFMANFVKCAK